MRLRLYSIIVMALLLVGCANRGVGPQGGPKDTIPPVPVRCEPEMGMLNFHGDRIEITFDEYIQLDNVAKNMFISPPQQNTPEVKARGKKVSVQFKDTLRDSTTYTIDFGAAICDYREKVPLKGYSFYFSTGDEIDTLEYEGRVFDAQTLNPMYGITTGIYSNLADSAFEREPFLRIAQTDSSGRFIIKNIHPGTYRLFAVDDMSKDYRLTIGEGCAFMDSTVRIPSEGTSTLFLFKEQLSKLYLQRVLRDQQHRIQFLFSAAPDSMPVIRPLADSLNYHIHYSARMDTVTVWLTDSMSIRQDSLFFEARYRQSDSLYNNVWMTDTLRTIWRTPKLSQKAQEALDRQNRNRRLDLSSNARKGFETFDTLKIKCTTPLADVNKEAMHLMEIKDTVRRPIPFTIAEHDTLPMTIAVLADFQPEGNYELQLDSAALHDIYGITHIAATYGLLVKAVSDYSTLRVKLVPFEPAARIQLMNTKDQVLKELPASEDGAFFDFLKPDAYYLRLYLDLNGDGKWTTGNWDERRQPEPIYYFPEKVQTKSNWDFEEEWDYKAVEQTQSKPKELIKLTPKK